MKNKYLLLIGILLCACSSTTENKNKVAADNEIPYYPATNADSIRVAELITQFMDLIKEGEYDLAIDKIYHQDEEDIYADPQPFSDDSRIGLKRMLQFSPIYSYNIEEYNFKTASESQITVSINVAGLDGNDSGRRTKLAFYPVCYVGNWLLCMRQSSKTIK